MLPMEAAITHLLINVGLGAGLALFFVYRDSQRLTKMEAFQQETLVKLVVESTAAATATANAILTLTDELKTHHEVFHAQQSCANPGD